MFVSVYLMSSTGGERLVHVPDAIMYGNDNLVAKLANVYAFGQNENDPQPRPSVSEGDVIILDGQMYRVGSGFGFHKLSADDWDAYRKAERRDRLFMFDN